MMSMKQWLALFTLFVLYLLLGAALFYHIESNLEIERRQKEFNEGLEIQGFRRDVDEIYGLLGYYTASCALLLSHYAVDSRSDQADIMEKLSQYCKRPMLALINGTNVEDFEPFLWDFYNSVFFVITVVSTIGYGNLVPSSDLGRMIMIFYALIGIPINGIMLASLAEFFSRALVRVHVRYKTKPFQTRAGMVADIVLYLIPGFVIFLFLPSGVFMHFEGWTFIESLYYAFVTLATIGFGDLVAGQTDKHLDSEGLYMLYKVMLLVWIVFGLGYLVMILGFISSAMRSKRVARLERKLALNIKHTQSKLWSSLARDVSYLRRVLNEMYVMKLKPVYKDEEEPVDTMRTRSNSDPILYGLSSREKELAPGFGVWRRRTNSETAAATQKVPRVLSESDLERIDRDATFKSISAMIQPGELLAHMVNALGDEHKGVQGFSDEEILAGEDRNATWTIGEEVITKRRDRAASEVRIPIREQQNDAEWTWSGDEGSRRVHELFRARHKSLVPPDHKTRRPSIFQLAAARIKQPLKKRHKSQSIGNIFPAEENPPFMHHPMHPALEETSLADFLRAVSSIQSRVATPPNSLPPRRKIGIGSFTPSGSVTTLFPPSSKDRRMSLHPTPVSPLNHVASRRASVAPLSPPPMMNRRMSLHPLVPRAPPASTRRGSIHPAIRRFSVRPVTSPLINPLPPSTTTPTPPPTPLHLMAPHLFSRQANDADHGNRKLT